MTRIGWCPGGRTVADMLALYPGTSAVRIFFGPGDGLPASAWTDPRQALSQVPHDADVIVSHKDQGVDAAAFVAAWEATDRTGRLILVPHHEPEQQTSGDPTPAQFRASWTRTREQVGAHPARAEGRLRLAVCYTLQWIRAGGNWRTWWPDHEAVAVDLLLFDWYQYAPGAPNPWRPTSYEDPASAVAPMTTIANAVGKDWGVAEADHLRITKANGFAVDLDPTGEMCAAWYRRMFAAAKAAGCRVWCHFHRGHGDLTSRLPEQQALRELIEQEATMGRWTDLAKWVGPTPNQSGPMNRHDGVVLHIAAGTYDGTIAWQRNPDANVSSHFIVAKDGRIAQMVDTNVTAWTQRDGNGEWLSVENAGFLPDPLTPEQVEANARILAKAHQVYGVPLQVTNTPATRGLGHHSMGAESGYDWGHPACPGAAIKAQKAEIVARAKQIINGEEPDMPLTDAEKDDIALRTTRAVLSARLGKSTVTVAQVLQGMTTAFAAEGTNPTELAAAIAALPQPALVDVQVIVAGVLAGLSPEAIAAAIPPALVEQVADELAARLAG